VTSLLIATRNAHKTREIQEILGSDFEVRDLTAHLEIPETTESGKTFEENAILKAVAVSRECSGLVAADDSGLEVDALGGAPGIFSARYAGKDATDKQNVDKLLGELARHLSWRNVPSSELSKRKVGNLPNLSARFRCVLALARSGKILTTFEGIVEGRIIDVPKGKHGFGYDPAFVPNGFSETFAELPSDTKNRISHRTKTLAKLKQYLRDL
jgi:XTP/dITP diphosphohydrolase